jgi:hypothetical protein
METQRVGIDLFKKLLTPDVSSAHILAFGAAFGAQAWFTFVEGPLLYANLPRQQFGNLMEKVFPSYFAFNSILGGVLLGTFAYQHPVVRRKPFDIFDGTVYQAFTLATGIAANLVNTLVIAPASYKLMHDRHRQEKVEGKSYDDAGVSDKMQALNKEFAGLHSISTLLNVASFGGICLHGLYLAKYGMSAFSKVLE